MGKGCENVTRTLFRLKGHETFVPREGWITKGLEAVAANPLIFSTQNYYGADDLGVGSNMAKSIRYWMHVMGLSQKDRDGEHLTPLGEQVLKQDMYLEEDFTLWLLHYHLVNDKKNATSWYLYFQKGMETELSKEGLYQFLVQQLEQEMGVFAYAEKSLRDDVTALISMYCQGNEWKKNQDPEDKSVCPFARLGLMRQEGKRYVSCEPDYENVSELLVLYAICHFFEQQAQEKNMSAIKSVSLETLLQGKGGVASCFHMNSVMLNDYLDRLESQGLVKVNRTAGLDMVYETENTPKTPLGVLRMYWER